MVLASFKRPGPIQLSVGARVLHPTRERNTSRFFSRAGGWNDVIEFRSATSMDHHNSPEALLDRLDGLLAATEVPASPSYGEDLNDSEYTVQYDQFRQVKVFIRKLTRLYFPPVWPTRLGNVTVTQSYIWSSYLHWVPLQKCTIHIWYYQSDDCAWRAWIGGNKVVYCFCFFWSVKVFV